MYEYSSTKGETPLPKGARASSDRRNRRTSSETMPTSITGRLRLVRECNSNFTVDDTNVKKIGSGRCRPRAQGAKPEIKDAEHVAF